MIAALYIDAAGPYPRMPDVDAWDVTRDATRYAGPWPVVAHPPCGPWGRLRKLSKHDDPALALRAVDQVRAYGGVLEHPECSALWRTRKLPLPGELPDAWGGFTLQVDQVAYGHVARKRTWLYCVGIDRAWATSAVRTGGTPTHWISGTYKTQTSGRRNRGTCPPHIKMCSAEQRRLTPLAFAKWLVQLAQSVQPMAAEVAA
jgi:hypothetical protein